MYEIIKNADLPAMKRTNPNQYPLSALVVGDGFDALNDMGVSPKGHSRRITSIKNAISKYRKTVDPTARFVVGISRDNGYLIRCVRVA